MFQSFYHDPINKSLALTITPVGSQCNDDETKTVNLTKQNLIFNNQQCVVLTFVDMTTAKRLAFIQSQQQKMHMHQSSISHEIITPLKLIRMFSKELRSECQREQRFETARHAEYIYTTSKIIQAHVSNLLVNNLLEKDKLNLNLKQVPLVKTIEKTMNIFRIQCESMGQTLKYEGLANETVVETDKVRV